MPIARVRMPDGRIAKIQVPEGTTPEEVEAFVTKELSGQPVDSTKEEEQEVGLGDRLIGAADVGATLARGAIAEPLAGLAGIGAAIIPGGKTGAEAVESARETLGREPTTEQGRAQLATIGNVVEKIPAIGQPMGDFVFEQTGSPALAAAAASTPTLLAELVGVGAIKSLRAGTPLLTATGEATKTLRKALNKHGLDFENLSTDARALIPETAPGSLITGKPLQKSTAEKALVAQIKSGARDDSLAGVKVKKGRPVPDKLGLEAIRQGFDPGFVQSVKVATPQTKAAMERMLAIMRQVKSSRRKGLDVRPSDVAGDLITDRIKFVRNKADAARKELDVIANEKLAGVKVSGGPIIDKLEDSLQKLDVSLVDTGQAKPGLNFSGSMISKDRTSQRVIKDLVDLMAEGGVPDAKRFHKLKRQLDVIIDFRKKSPGGLTEAGRGILKDMRATLNESIREVSPAYAKVNDTLSKSLTALDNFQKANGTSIDMFGRGANSAIGTNMRALISNRRGRVNIENALKELIDVSDDLGGTFGADVKDLVMFSDGIEDVFGAAARTSFKGEIESAVKQAGGQGAAATVAQRGFDVAAKKLEGLRGINDFNAFESMRAILKRVNNE